MDLALTIPCGGIITVALLRTLHRKNLTITKTHEKQAQQFYNKRYSNISPVWKDFLIMIFRTSMPKSPQITSELQKIKQLPQDNNNVPVNQGKLEINDVPTLETKANLAMPIPSKFTTPVTPNPVSAPKTNTIPYVLLTTQSQLAQASKHLSMSQEIAVDCEGVNMSNTGILCLVQIAAPAVLPGMRN
jgi:hypothetical protein